MRASRRGGLFRHNERTEEHIPTPRSCVRVLQDSQELAEAIQRAMSYETSTTERVRERLVRYGEELQSSRPVVVAMPEPTSPVEGDGGRAESA